MTGYTELVKTVNIPELVKALRYCTTRRSGCVTCAGCPMSSENGDVIECINALHKDAAAAIEALQAEAEELKRVNMELFEDLPKYGEQISHLASAEEPPKEEGWYLLCYLSKWNGKEWWLPKFPDYWAEPPQEVQE